MEQIQHFVFLYPFFMGLFWIVGTLVFFFRRERQRPERPVFDEHPLVSVLVPCHNEQVSVRETIEQLMRSAYPRFEVIAINDCSSDRTGEILAELETEFENLRLITLDRNFGKAAALNMGALAAHGDFLMCIDADCLLDEDALHWMLAPMLQHTRVGAVTGNPRVLNRLTLLSRIQLGEFSAIVGMVKRAQRLIGRVYTVSGVTACFRRRALHQVGYWSSDTVTDDIDISWKLQLAHWTIQYEPCALCWILVPESFRGLWQQRLRWAQGGIEAALKHARPMAAWRKRRMWPVFMEQMVSVFWCYAVALVVLAWLLTVVLPHGAWPEVMRVPTLLPGWTGTLIALTCIAQFATGLAIDRHYEGRGVLRMLFWAIWYPVVYWLIIAATTVVAVPRVLAQRKKRFSYATWKSPDR